MIDGAQPVQTGEPARESDTWPPAVGPGRAVWRPAAGYGRLVGGLIIVALLAAGGIALLLLIQDDGPIRILWLLMLAGALAGVLVVGRLVRGLASLRYVFAEDHLRIEWQRSVRRIPYNDMLEVVYHLREQVELPGREPYWPGFRISTVRTRNGVWHSYATVPPHRRIRITTPAAVFAISPERPVLFIQELERRRGGRPADVSASAVGTVTPVQPVRVRAGLGQSILVPVQRSIELFRNDLLTDRIASTLVAVSIIIPVFMLAYTFNEVDFLPERIPLHWNADGEVDRSGPSRSIWTLPLLALTVLAINASLATMILPLDRVAARLMMAVTPVVQIAATVALLRIIG